MRRSAVLCGTLMVWLLVLAACGGQGEAEPEADEPGVVQVEPTSAAAEVEEAGEREADAEPVVQPATAEEEAPTCRTLQQLNFRTGPGLAYEPPIRAFPANTLLTPLAFSATGFPGGQWLLVRDEAAGETGWVSAGTQFVACNVAVSSLSPATNLPPTPTAAPPPTRAATATPQAVAGGPPRVKNNAPGGTAAEYVDGEVIVDDSFLFRMKVADTRFGTQDGAGIDHVEFFISTPEGDPVFSHRENVAGYCIFRGGEPNCNPWPQENGRFVWGNGSQAEAGTYHATILVFPQAPAFDGEVWNWDFDFTLELP